MTTIEELRLTWTDPNVWASWEVCGWQPDVNDVQWECSLPVGHTGPHIAFQDMEHAPTDESYIAGTIADDTAIWAAPPLCADCGYPHPGFRHATADDRIVICEHVSDNAWGPAPSGVYGYSGPRPDSRVPTYGMYVPTFLDPPFPTPPKFNSIEEVEAWLEQHQPR
jgi:hypothetical protein